MACFLLASFCGTAAALQANVLRGHHPATAATAATATRQLRTRQFRLSAAAAAAEEAAPGSAAELHNLLLSRGALSLHAAADTAGAAAHVWERVELRTLTGGKSKTAVGCTYVDATARSSSSSSITSPSTSTTLSLTRRACTGATRAVRCSPSWRSCWVHSAGPSGRPKPRRARVRRRRRRRRRLTLEQLVGVVDALGVLADDPDHARLGLGLVERVQVLAQRADDALVPACGLGVGVRVGVGG